MSVFKDMPGAKTIVNTYLTFHKVSHHMRNMARLA